MQTDDCFFRINEYSVVIFLKQNVTLHVSGFLHFTSLHGDLSINGYHTPPKKPINVQSPSWLPALPIESNSSSVEPRHVRYTMQQLLSNLTDLCSSLSDDKYDIISSHLHKLRLDAYANIFLLQGRSKEEQEWMESAEIQSNFLSIENECEIIPIKDHMIKLTSAVVANASLLSTIGVSCLKYPSSWQQAIHHINNASTYTHDEEMKILLCGARNTGKSTYLRYLLNSLLNHQYDQEGLKKTSSWCGKICMIDCDLGQPECYLPGFVSLTIFDFNDPILSPPYFNIHRKNIDTKYFIGELTSKNNPLLIINCIKKLMERYQQILNEMKELNEKKIKRKNDKMILNNPFNILLLDKIDKKNDPKVLKRIKGKTILPLIINTDGYMKHMGGEVFNNILHIIQPSYILHIASSLIEKEFLLYQHEYFNILLDNKNHEQQQLHTTSTIDDHEKKQKRIVLEPRLQLEHQQSDTKTIISPIDMRNLRWISYFLRFENSLKYFSLFSMKDQLLIMNHNKDDDDEEEVEEVEEESDSIQHPIVFQQLNNNTNTNSDDDEEEEEIIKNTSLIGKKRNISSIFQLNPIKSSYVFNINHGRINDSFGILGIKMMSLQTYFIPFSCLIFIKTSIENERLFLASINASIICLFKISKINYFYHQNLFYKKNFQYENKKFSLNFIKNELFNELNENIQCIGMGFIRGINIHEKYILLIKPSILKEESWFNKEENNDEFIIIIKRGNLILPTNLIYSSWQPCNKYFTNEMFGAGNNEMKSRNNIQRRLN